MLCPKCKNQNRGENFCGNCGSQLKERCSICGKMEYIGRPNCETLIEDINIQCQQVRLRGTKKSGGFWGGIAFLFIYLALSAFVLTQISLPIPLQTPSFQMDVLILIIFLAWVFTGALPSTFYMSWQNKKQWRIMEKNEEKFWTENPNLKAKWDEHQEWTRNR